MTPGARQNRRNKAKMNEILEGLGTSEARAKMLLQILAPEDRDVLLAEDRRRRVSAELRDAPWTLWAEWGRQVIDRLLKKGERKRKVEELIKKAEKMRAAKKRREKILRARGQRERACA